MYVFMDTDYNQFEVEAENMGDAISYLEDGMPVEVVFYDGKAISVELPTSGGARDRDRAGRQGRHRARWMKPARPVGTGFEISVPLFVENGDKVEIDTRTHVNTASAFEAAIARRLDRRLWAPSFQHFIAPVRSISAPSAPRSACPGLRALPPGAVQLTPIRPASARSPRSSPC